MELYYVIETLEGILKYNNEEMEFDTEFEASNYIDDHPELKDPLIRIAIGIKKKR